MKPTITYSFSKILIENVLIVGFIQAFFFLVCLLRRFLFQVKEIKGERQLERGMRGEIAAL